MGVQSCEESTVAVQFTMKAFVAVLSCLAVAAAKPSLVAQAPLAYNYGYNGLINTAYAGYAAPAVAHAGVYAAPAAAIAVNPYAYANAYPAAEPYIHQEILAEPYIHDASGELSPAAELTRGVVDVGLGGGRQLTRG